MSAASLLPEDVRRRLLMLSEPEYEVCELVVLGVKTREIADERDVSAQAIRNHKQNAREKLGLSNDVDLTRFWMQWVEGWTPPEVA